MTIPSMISNARRGGLKIGDMICLSWEYSNLLVYSDECRSLIGLFIISCIYAAMTIPSMISKANVKQAVLKNGDIDGRSAEYSNLLVFLDVCRGPVD